MARERDRRSPAAFPPGRPAMSCGRPSPEAVRTARDAVREAVRTRPADRRTTPRRDEDVLEAQLERIHVELRGDLVDLGLAGEGDLRIAEAAEGARTQLVGVDDLAVAARVRNAVGPARHQERVAEHARAVVAIGAAVEVKLAARGRPRCRPASPPVRTRSLAGWRTRTISKSSSRAQDQLDRAGRYASASLTAIGWTCASILLPKPPPMPRRDAAQPRHRQA